MKRLALLSCALLVACGGSKTEQQQMYDLSGYDLPNNGDLAHIADLLEPADMTVVPGDMTVVGDMTPAADMAMSADAPVIIIQAPTTNQKSNNVVVKAAVASPVDSTIVSVTATIGTGTTAAQAILTQVMSGMWQGAADVTAVPSGPNVPIVVTAVDVNNLTGTKSSTFTLDHGPNIVFVQPTQATAKDSIPFKVTVTDPLGQALSASNVTVAVHSPGDVKNVMTTNTTPSSLTLQGTITFSDFMPALTGDQVITVTATNMDLATSTAQKTFTVDQAGPDITIESPAENSFAGGLITISATVQDVSGVNAASVFAEFTSGNTYKVMLTSMGSGKYGALFDLAQLGTNYSYPTVSVTADDNLGNEHSLSQSFYLDNSKPKLSLSPPDVRVRRPSDGVCSELFNPVGNDAIKDLTNNALQAITLRARIEDQANSVPGQTVLHPSGIDTSTVRLIVSPASTAGGAKPVLVVNDNTVKDSTDCNAINPLLTPVASGTVAQGQYLSLPMGQITASGTPDFSPDTTTPLPPTCTAIGDTGATPPAPMCAGTALGYTLQYLTVATPAIWSLPQITSPPDPQCGGQQFDDGNIPEGWACFAVVAKDIIGNKAVSPPLRACIRRTSMPNHPCDSQTAPDCTGTYTPAVGMTPASTDPDTHCTAVNFTAELPRDLNQ